MEFYTIRSKLKCCQYNEMLLKNQDIFFILNNIELITKKSLNIQSFE